MLFAFVRLTSLMLDYTVLLRNVVSWDKEQVVETLEWLAKQQKEDGSFVEHNEVIVLRKLVVRYFKNDS